MKIFRLTSYRTPAVGLMLAVPLVVVAQSASRPPTDQVEDYIKGSALVGFEWVDQPLNRVLLIRGNQSTCAIRFLSYRRANDARPPTSFDTGEASLFAEYEVAELVITRSEVSIGPVTRRRLDYRGLRGLGRIAFSIGDDDIRCGRDRYTWLFPTGLFLREDPKNASIAPTNWKSFNDVRLDHPKLLWYQRDRLLQRPLMVIPKEDLPPGQVNDPEPTNVQKSLSRSAGRET